MHKRIEDWKKKPAYRVGVELYGQLPTHIYPVRLFESYLLASWIPDDVLAKLHFCFDDYMSRFPRESKKNESYGTKETKKQESDQTAVQPAEIDLLKAKIKMLHKKQTWLKNKIADTSFSQKQRLGIIMELMNVVTPELDQSYSHLKSWRSTGEIPIQEQSEQAEDIKTKTIKAMQRLNTLKSRISRLKKRKDPDAKVELAKKMSEAQELRTFLGI